MSRVDCIGSTYNLPECHQTGCPKCGTFTLEEVPANCTCTVEVAGFMWHAKRNEKCPEHGMCLCGWTDADDNYYMHKRYSGGCPIAYHSKQAGKVAY